MRSISIALMILLFFSFGVQAQTKGKKVVKAPAKMIAKKVPTPVKKPIQKQVLKTGPKDEETLAPTEDEKIADLKEEMNDAVKNLKIQLDGVKSDNGDAKVSSVVFFQWQKYTQNAGSSNYNNFDVTRAYLDFKKKLDGDASARVTLDVKRLDTSAATKNGSGAVTDVGGTDPNKKTQNLFDYLKYAYLEKPVPIPAALQPVPFNLNARLGLQHTAWIDWADKVLNLRFIAKTLLDNEGVMSSSDFGLGALGKVSVNGLPELEYHATLLNGAGYAKPESDARKDLGLRVNSTVYQDEKLGSVVVGLFGTAVGVKSDGSTDNSTKKQAAAMIALKNDLISTNFEYLYGTNISGYSLGATYLINPGWMVFARLDNYDPARSVSNNEINRSFYGLIYDWGKDVRIAADLQNSQTGTGSTTSIFYLHSMITI